MVRKLVKTLTVVDSPELNWVNAKAACEEKGATLLTLPSYAELAELPDLITDDKYYWIGGHCPGEN